MFPIKVRNRRIFNLKDEQKITYTGILKGVLDSEKPVPSFLKNHLYDHFQKVQSESRMGNLVSYSDDPIRNQEISLLNSLLLGTNKNKNNRFRPQIIKRIVKELNDEKSVAIIGEKVFEIMMETNQQQLHSNWINFEDIQLQSGGSKCDINVLPYDFPVSELKELGQKEMHFKYPRDSFKTIMGTLLGLLSIFSSDRGSGSRILWKYASEENEYRIKLDTPLMLLGEFTFTGGKMKANRLHFFGKNIYNLIENVNNSIWKWRLFGLICFSGLAVYSLQKLIMIRYRYKANELKREQQKMEEMLIQQSETINENYKCVICYQYIRNIIFEPCKHLVCCLFCMKSMQEVGVATANKCPMCKVPISRYTRIAYKNN